MSQRSRKLPARLPLRMSFFATSVVLLILSIYPPAATRAQGSGALVVSVCGTLPNAYSVGATRQITVNTAGQTCVS